MNWTFLVRKGNDDHGGDYLTSSQGLPTGCTDTAEKAFDWMLDRVHHCAKETGKYTGWLESANGTTLRYRIKVISVEERQVVAQLVDAPKKAQRYAPKGT